MSDRTIDARGMPCPQPLMLTKKALDELNSGERIRVLIDNDVARENLMQFLRDHDSNPQFTDEKLFYSIAATKSGEGSATGEVAAYCAAPVEFAGPVLVLNGQGMGSGSEELGKILLQACVNTLKDVTPLPRAILCYNAGVFVVAEGAPTVAGLKQLVAQGVTLLVCGTCVDYFGIKDRIAVGTISNMYDILQQLSNAARVMTL